MTRGRPPGSRDKSPRLKGPSKNPRELKRKERLRFREFLLKEELARDPASSRVKLIRQMRPRPQRGQQDDPAWTADYIARRNAEENE